MACYTYAELYERGVLVRDYAFLQILEPGELYKAQLRSTTYKYLSRFGSYEPFKYKINDIFMFLDLISYKNDSFLCEILFKDEVCKLFMYSSFIAKLVKIS